MGGCGCLGGFGVVLSLIGGQLHFGLLLFELGLGGVDFGSLCALLPAQLGQAAKLSGSLALEGGDGFAQLIGLLFLRHGAFGVQLDAVFDNAVQLGLRIVDLRVQALDALLDLLHLFAQLAIAGLELRKGLLAGF